MCDNASCSVRLIEEGRGPFAKYAITRSNGGGYKLNECRGMKFGVAVFGGSNTQTWYHSDKIHLKLFFTVDFDLSSLSFLEVKCNVFITYTYCNNDGVITSHLANIFNPLPCLSISYNRTYYYSARQEQLLFIYFY